MSVDESFEFLREVHKHVTELIICLLAPGLGVANRVLGVIALGLLFRLMMCHCNVLDLLLFIYPILTYPVLQNKGIASVVAISSLTASFPFRCP